MQRARVVDRRTSTYLSGLRDPSAPGASIQEGLQRMRCLGFVGILLLLLLNTAAPAAAQVSIGIGVPSLDIGIHFGALPSLTIVPGTPVYYAPAVDANFFFYDGMYWVLKDDNWYASSWYNGPWAVVDPEIVPDFLLRVPVRYYRRPPTYFRGWAVSAPPRWSEHWGRGWEEKHHGWEQAARAPVPRAAPVPTYQRQYAGKRYPTPEQQPVLHSQNYKYQPHEAVVQQHYQQHAAPQQHGQAHSGGHEKDEGHSK
jgi:hypothetical protein